MATPCAIMRSRPTSRKHRTRISRSPPSEYHCLDAATLARAAVPRCDVDDRWREQRCLHAFHVVGIAQANQRIGQLVGMKIRPLPVLYDLPQQDLLILRRLHPAGDIVQLELLARLVAPLAGNDLVVVVVLDIAEFQNLVNTYRSPEDFCRALFTIEENFDRNGGIGEYVFHPTRIATYRQ